MYHERSLVSSHATPAAAPVMGLAFGRYAREDNTLVTVTRGGGLDIKASGLGVQFRGVLLTFRGIAFRHRPAHICHRASGRLPSRRPGWGRAAHGTGTLASSNSSYACALLVQIMPRTANLEAPSVAGGPPPEQDVPLPVPAKTRLYVEQMQVGAT